MHIHEAIEATTEEKPFVTRKAWFHKFYIKDCKGTGRTTRVIPTDGPSRCLVVSPLEGCIGSWAPSKTDLLADDWEPTI